MQNYTYKNDDAKSFDFSPWGGLDGFLKATSNGAATNNKGMALKRLVPDLSRAVDMTATAVSSLPFSFKNKAGDIIDSSSDWKNEIGGLNSPKRLFYLIASSLCGGAAYVVPHRTPKFVYDLQYIVPHSVNPFITRRGLEYFNRVADTGIVERYNPQQIIYFWLPDSDIEIGQALNTPLGNAVQDAELSLNSKNTMRMYGERGFVPITLLGAKGMVNDSEQKKAEGFFDRLLKGGFDVLAKIVNSEALTLIKVGAGMDELKQSYVEILRQSKEDIAQAFGIPTALFMSDNAFASEFDALTRQWYTTSRFRSIYQTIEETFNQQLLKPYGVTMSFDLNELDIFQADENERANSVSSYASTIEKSPKIAKFVFDFMGVDLDEAQQKELDAMITELEKKQEQEQEQVSLIDSEDKDAEQNNQPVNLSPDEMKDISLWYSKAVAWHKQNKSAVDWENKNLREDVVLFIRKKLINAKTLNEIKSAFNVTGLYTKPEKSDIKILADSLNKLADSMTHKESDK